MIARQPSARAKQLCTFIVGDLFFGVDVMRVQEIIRYQEMTPVPLTSAVISGLINLRGQIVTAIDLRHLLGLPQRTVDVPMNVVVRTGDSVVSILVDDIGDVLEVDTSAFERAPDTLESRSKDLIDGVYKLAGRILLSLDTDLVVRAAEVMSDGSHHEKR